MNRSMITAALITAAGLAATVTSANAANAPGYQKGYGIAAAGKNDFIELLSR